MREEYCDACYELNDGAYEFVENGVTPKIDTRLRNDQGFSTDPDINTDCEALNLANDCLIGGMEDELENYDVCDIKTWLKKFAANLHSVGKAVISAICGLWTNVHNLWQQINNINNRLDDLAEQIEELGKNTILSAKAFVNHIRDYGSGGSAYFQSFNDHDSHTQNYYMDATHTSYGSKVADRDYIVMISHCFNVQRVRSFDAVVTWFSSGDSRSMSAIRNEIGQHPTVLGWPDHDEFPFSDMSWTLSTAIIVRKGEYVRSEIYCIDSTPISGETAQARIHQIAMTWIPVNLGTTE